MRDRVGLHARGDKQGRARHPVRARPADEDGHTSLDADLTPDDRRPVVLRGNDSIAVALHKMAVGGFRHIPLVENGHATGIVSARDVFRHILAALK